jgi:hypothetical protein
MSRVVSVRVHKEVLQVLEDAGVDVAGKTRTYLEDLAWECRTKATLAELRGIIQKDVRPARKGSSAKLIREDRDAHR